MRYRAITLPITETKLRSICREHTEASVDTIVAIRDNHDVPPNVRLAAAIALIDRGWGRPKEVEERSSEGQRRLVVVRQIVHVSKTKEELRDEDLVVDYSEIKNGNGHDGTSGS